MHNVTSTNILHPILLAVLVASIAPFVAQAASFDCSKAATTIEKQICADPELSSLDDQISVEYKKVYEISQVKEESLRNQRVWLKSRDACQDKACLKNSYEKRLLNLRTTYHSFSMMTATPPPGKSLYVLEKGKGVEVCEAYEKNLNSFKPRLPMVCGRPASVALGFSKPKWEQPLHTPNGQAMPFKDYGEFLWERDVNPVRYYRNDRWTEWKATPDQLKEAHRSYLVNRERFWAQIPPLLAEFDIDNDGKSDHVYFEHPCGSVYGDVFAVLTEDYKTVDRKRTERLLPHPPFKQMGLGYFRSVKRGDWGVAPFFLERGYMPTEDAMGDVHYDFFIHKGKSYIDQWWSSHPDFHGESDMKAGRLRVFEPAPTGSKEICTYRFEFKG